RAPRLRLRLVAVLVGLALLAGIVIGNALAGGTPAGTTAPARSRPTTTRTQAQAGRSTKVRNATGASYLQQEQSLPNSVTP
ncbi:MAG: hypothetical protein KGL16_04350, partial [Acidobacteriota bacterium]|nr:hypothetical protein [Acidobacteriota bacterium]